MMVFGNEAKTEILKVIKSVKKKSQRPEPIDLGFGFIQTYVCTNTRVANWALFI